MTVLAAATCRLLQAVVSLPVTARRVISTKIDNNTCFVTLTAAAAVGDASRRRKNQYIATQEGDRDTYQPGIVVVMT